MRSEVVMLDEVTSSLDPELIGEVRRECLCNKNSLVAVRSSQSASIETARRFSNDCTHYSFLAQAFVDMRLVSYLMAAT